MLCSAALAALLAAAAPQEVDAPTPAPQRLPEATLVAEAHGGPEAILGLEGVRFQLTPLTYPPATEETPEPEPVAGDPLRFSIALDADRGRRVRIQQRSGDQDLVRVVSALTNRVWIGDEERDSPELAAESSVMAAEVFSVLDLVWGLASGQVVAAPGQRRTRDGVDYHTVRATFPPSRQLTSVYLLYVHPKTGLVDRVDVFDPATNRRSSTIFFSDYRGEAAKLPCRIDFVDRDKQPLTSWELSAPVFNPEWAEGHFERP